MLGIYKRLANIFDIRQAEIGVFVDGDNANASKFELSLQKIKELGRVEFVNIYCDFHETRVHPWCEVSRIHGAKRIQQDITKGKNSTDIALAVDAIVYVNEKKLKGVCIVSSDGDYSGLAERLVKKGVKVYGVGRKNTPLKLKNLCDRFITYEELEKTPNTNVSKAFKATPLFSTANKIVAKKKPPTKKMVRVQTPSLDKKTIEMINVAFEKCSKDGTRANLARIGFALHKLDPSIDPKRGYYGYKRLSQLVEQLSDKYRVESDVTRGPVPVKYMVLKS